VGIALENAVSLADTLLLTEATLTEVGDGYAERHRPELAAECHCHGHKPIPTLGNIEETPKVRWPAHHREPGFDAPRLGWSSRSLKGTHQPGTPQIRHSSGGTRARHPGAFTSFVPSAPISILIHSGRLLQKSRKRSGWWPTKFRRSTIASRQL
jgi:hypothetical protein